MRDGWTERRIGDVASVVTGATPSGKQHDNWGGVVPFLTPSDMNGADYSPAAARHLSAAAVTRMEARVIRRTATAVVCIGATIGKVARVTQPTLTNQQINTVVPDEVHLAGQYSYYAMQQIAPLLRQVASGSATPILNKSRFSDIRILLPPIAEQRRIAAVLGAFDDLIDTNQRLVRLLTDSVAVAFRVAARAAVDRVVPIGDLTAVVGGSTPKTGEPAYWNGTHAWATPRDLSRMTSIPLLSTERSITDDGLAKISSGSLPVGTLLMSSRAPIGYLAIAEIPVAINQGFIAMKQIDGGISNVYLWQWLSHNMEAVRDRSNGSTFQEISKVNFRPIEVPVPAPAALATFEAVAQPAYKAIVGLENETTQLRQARDELLPLLMSGAVSPGEVEVAA